MTIQKLMELRAKTWDEARNFLDSKRNDSGVLSEEDSKTYDEMEKKIVDLGKEIERMERMEKLNAEMSKPTSEPVMTQPGDHIDSKPSVTSAEYSEAFWNSVRNRYYVSNDLQVGTDTEGGYLVPDEFVRL